MKQGIKQKLDNRVHFVGVTKTTVLFIQHYNLFAYLGRQELQEYNALRKNRQLDWLAGRLALKEAYRNSVADYSVRLSNVRVESFPSGQPFLAGQADLCCSLAHSFGWGVGIVASSPIGIDIEKIRPHTEDFLQYIGSKSEIDKLQNVFQNPQEATTAFWTVKEAVLKGLGTGLAVSPRKLETVQLKESFFVVDVHSDIRSRASRWYVFLYREEDFYISMACTTLLGRAPEIVWVNKERYNKIKGRKRECKIE